MADSFVIKLITELTAKTTATDTDLVPIADSNGNFFKMTWQKLKQLLLGTKDISGVGDGTVTGAISELNTKIGNHGFTLIANAYTDSAGVTTTTGVNLDEYDAFLFAYKYGNVYTTSFLSPTSQLKSMTSTQNCINMDHRKNDDVACLIYTDGSKNIKIFHNTAYYPVSVWGIKF